MLDLDAIAEMLESAEMRWVSVEDSLMTVRARLVAKLGRERDSLKEGVEAALSVPHRLGESRAVQVEEMRRILAAVVSRPGTETGP